MDLIKYQQSILGNKNKKKKNVREIKILYVEE